MLGKCLISPKVNNSSFLSQIETKKRTLIAYLKHKLSNSKTENKDKNLKY